MSPRPTLGPIAITLALFLLVWFWATADALQPVPVVAYIVPVTIAGLLVLVVLAMMESR